MQDCGCELAESQDFFSFFDICNWTIIKDTLEKLLNGQLSFFYGFCLKFGDELLCEKWRIEPHSSCHHHFLYLQKIFKPWVNGRSLAMIIDLHDVHCILTEKALSSLSAEDADFDVFFELKLIMLFKFFIQNPDEFLLILFL